jgi:dienelactone hydrolase
MFQNFLTEIASHGFLVLANGAAASGGQLPASNLLSGLAAGLGGVVQGSTLISSVSEQAKSIDWATTGGAGNGKYGEIDSEKLAVAGQSCGGLESYSASYQEPKVKLTVLFDSGILSESKLPLLKKLKAPVSFFLSGPKDIAYAQVGCSYSSFIVAQTLF